MPVYTQPGLQALRCTHRGGPRGHFRNASRLPRWLVVGRLAPMSRQITGNRTLTREQVLAGLVLALGAFSTVCAFVPAWHVPGSWTGLIGLALGAVAQMLSTSTAQRWVIVPGWVLSFIGLAVGIDNGGLW
jgi:hypothetical protein